MGKLSRSLYQGSVTRTVLQPLISVSPSVIFSSSHFPGSPATGHGHGTKFQQTECKLKYPMAASKNLRALSFLLSSHPLPLTQMAPPCTLGTRSRTREGNRVIWRERGSLKTPSSQRLCIFQNPTGERKLHLILKHWYSVTLLPQNLILIETDFHLLLTPETASGRSSTELTLRSRLSFQPLLAGEGRFQQHQPFIWCRTRKSES